MDAFRRRSQTPPAELVWIHHARRIRAWNHRADGASAARGHAGPSRPARACGRDGARRGGTAGVVVETLETLPELDAASSLIERIWDDGEPKAPTTLLRALSHAGGFVAGAYDDEEFVGVSFGFFGLDTSELRLHSHITGVDPRFRGRSVGYALKQFQRSWALARGITTAQWTAIRSCAGTRTSTS